MANSDKLWFELGVRDEVSKTLSDIMNQAEALKDMMDDITLGKDAVRNAQDIEQALDRIAVARNRISEAKSLAGNKNDIDLLNKMEREITKVQKKFEKIGKMGDDVTQAMMGTKGFASYVKMLNNLPLALDQIRRKTGEITAQAEADARAKVAEANRIDTLKDKYNELYRVRKQLQDAVLSATPGTDTTNAVSMINSLSSRMGAVRRAQNGGTGIPSSVQGADAAEFMRRVKDETKALTSATDEYNRRISTTAGIHANLKRLVLDTESQQRIAGIRRQTSEYNALGRKLRDIQDLMRRVETERAELESGRSTTPRYTSSFVNGELDAIQRRYNEDVARGRQLERDDTDAKNKKAAATKKAADAVQMLAHVNQSLISSYHRIAEAGSNANRITIQLQNQLAGYAGLYGIERIVKSIITIGGQFEVQHVALQNIIGDIQQANILFSQLQGLAVESPKTFMELTAYAKQLSAYQIPVNELFDTTKRLADMSSGLGVDMNRLILAYGQVRSAAVLRGQELRQFTEAGIPMVQALADKFTEMNGKLTTTADVFGLISKRAVPFEMVKEVLWDMTNQGGQFYNMQSELADTLYGKWQKLQDQWQITLGHIADGKTLTGGFLKMVLEGLVSIATAFDTITPLIGMWATGRLGLGVFNGLRSAVQNQNGTTAVRNMELTKLKDANRLERERVMYGRQLNQQERQLINRKNVLTANEMRLLLLEGQITERQLMQLTNAGKLNRLEMLKLLYAQGYTKQQIQQIINGNLQLLKGGGSVLGKIGNGISGFLGGPVGIAMTAIGGLLSTIGYFEEKAAALKQKGDSMMTSAQQQSNTLTKALDASEKDGSIEKHIEAMEDALLQLGNTGEAVVAKSRENMEDMAKRWEVLKKGAENYNKVLGLMGSQEGRALFESAIDKSDIEERLKDYDEATSKAFKARSGFMNFEAMLNRAIERISKSDSGISSALSGKNFFEKIDYVGYDKLYRELYSNRKDYGPMYASAVTALKAYFDVLEKVDAKWDAVSEKSIPKMTNQLIAAARKLGIESFEGLDDDQKQSLELIARKFAHDLQSGSQEAKNKLAEELASQVFYIKIQGDLSIGNTKMSSFANYIWGHFGGNLAGDNGTIKIGNKTYTKAQVSNIFGDVDEFAKDYNSQVESLAKTVSRLQKAGADKLAEETDAERDDILSVLNALGLFEDKNKGNGRKEDEQLKRWREEWGELKSFYSEFKKWAQQIGSDAALKKLRETGLWGQFFNADGTTRYDMQNWDKAIGDFRKKLSGGSVEREKFLFDVSKEQLTPQYDQAKEAADAILKQLDKALKEQGKRWDLYKKVVEATGDKRQAGEIAFGGGVSFKDYADELRAGLETALLKNQKAQGHSIDELLGMDDEALRKLDIFKENTDGVYQKLQLLREEMPKVKSEEVSLLLDALKNAKSLDTELALVRSRYERTRNAIRGDKTMPQSQKDALLGNADTNESKETADLQWKYFKQTDEWGRVFGNLDKMSSATLSRMRDKLTELAPSVRDSVEATKALYEAIDKIDKAANSRNPFKAMSDALGRASSIRELLGSVQGRADSDSVYVSDYTAKKTGIKKGIRKVGDVRSEAADGLRGTEEDFKNGLNGLTQKFKAVQEALQPVIELFDQLGMTAMSDFFQMGSNALGAASQMGGGAAALFGASAGQWGAAIGAGLSVVSSVLAMHDKSLQREIDASKQRQAEMENLTRNLDSVLERVLGGIYSVKVGERDTIKLQDYLNLYGQTQKASEEIKKARLGTREYYENYKAIQAGSYISDDTVESIKKALESEEYFDTKLAELKIQRDEIQHQLEDEEDKKKKDNDAIESTKQKLIEMDDQIKNYALDMADALYSINLQEWASQLTDAIVGAWERGESAIDAYRTKAKELMKDLTKNILAKRVLEQAFSQLGIDQIIANEMFDTSGKLNEGSIPKIADALYKAGELTTDVISKTLDRLEDSGYIDRGDGKSSSSSSGIRGITEDTADLLLSYVNAIRADVSIERTTLDAIRSAVELSATRNMLTEAQERNLENIAAYTERTALASEAIQELLNGNVMGRNTFRVK